MDRFIRTHCKFYLGPYQCFFFQICPYSLPRPLPSDIHQDQHCVDDRGRLGFQLWDHGPASGWDLGQAGREKGDVFLHNIEGRKQQVAQEVLDDFWLSSALEFFSTYSYELSIINS